MNGFYGGDEKSGRTRFFLVVLFFVVDKKSPILTSSQGLADNKEGGEGLWSCLWQVW
jgi:hypothetical protein